MFARLTMFRVKVDTIDEGVKRYQESVIPAAKSQKGYRGMYFMVDRNTGKGVSMSLWNSEKDAIANEKNRYYQEQLVKFIDLLIEPVIREGYEVTVQD